MQSVREALRERRWEGILYVLFFAGALVICHFVPYSDGDDAFFSEMANRMSLPEYLRMRYMTWEGRMTSEAMTYAAFRLGHTFWSWMNALMLTLLPAGLICLLRKIIRPQGAAAAFRVALYCFLGIALLGIMVLGYGGIWITGSTFYLWSIVAGIWAAMPFADLVWTGAYRRRSLIYAIPCGFIAAMGLEQITAVVIVFGILALIVYFYRNRQLCLPLALEVLIMVLALICLFLSPGTEARTQSEIATWLPEFSTISVGNHMFITLQWMLESLARDGKTLLAALWILQGLLMWRKGRPWQKGAGAVSVSMAAVALLPVFQVKGLTDLGSGVEDITQCVTQVAVPATLNGLQWAAFAFWGFGVLWTLWVLWQLGEDMLHRCFYVLLLLAGLASDGIMFFSPTMYASGARVHFMAHILLWFLVSLLACRAGEEPGSGGRTCRFVPALILLGLGAVNVVSGVPTIMSYLA